MVQLAHIPVVVTSANLQGHNQQSLHHAVEMLDKPLDIDIIFNAVHHYCADPMAHH